MCTVTFIPLRDKVFLTSSRDEIYFRSATYPPAIHQFNSGNLIFPRESVAGGTWICLHQNGNAVILLNGGFVKHVPQPPYRRSRGLILLEIADSDSPINNFSKIDLSGIEPFTVIIRDNSKLFECRWDGRKSHQKQISSYQPHLWCSVTLYDTTSITQRRLRFEKWLTRNPKPNLDRIMEFHQIEMNSDLRENSNNKKDDIVSPVSITGLELTTESGSMNYVDLITSQSHFEQIDFRKATPVRQ